MSELSVDVSHKDPSFSTMICQSKPLWLLRQHYKHDDLPCIDSDHIPYSCGRCAVLSFLQYWNRIQGWNRYTRISFIPLSRHFPAIDNASMKCYRQLDQSACHWHHLSQASLEIHATDWTLGKGYRILEVWWSARTQVWYYYNDVLFSTGDDSAIQPSKIGFSSSVSFDVVIRPFNHSDWGSNLLDQCGFVSTSNKYCNRRKWLQNKLKCPARLVVSFSCSLCLAYIETWLDKIYSRTLAMDDRD